MLEISAEKKTDGNVEQEIIVHCQNDLRSSPYDDMIYI